MNQEKRQCQNCKQEFVIEPEDFDFYEKMKVPAPTYCHDCKLQRRFLWRNERNLYKRTCDLCHKDIVSLYREDAPFPVYCNSCWYSDGWDALAMGKEYDFNRDFFSQFQELINAVPRPALIGTNNVNSPYINYSINLKNCYLGLCASECEDCGYIYRTFSTKNSFDCFSVVECELCAELTQSAKCFQTSYSKFTENAVDSLLVNDCKNISNCFGSTGLRNKQNVIFNQQRPKEEFDKIRSECGSYKKLQEYRQKAEELSLVFPRKYARLLHAINSIGEDLTNVKNCKNCFVIREGENLNYAYFGSNLKDGRDFNFADNSELIYESANIEKNYMELFSLTSWFSHFITYCDHCFSSQNLFGCVGLRDKQYCILNKQYTKEEYEKIVAQIIEKMTSDKEYGEFLPAKLSPFAYNETVAQEYFPLTKEEAIKQGYQWKDPEERGYKIDMLEENFPDDIRDADESIVNKIIGCAHKGTCNEQCTTAFKITSQELQFYKKVNLPLPRLCPNCRHYQRLTQRNPLKLWHRQCMCDKNHPHHTGKCTNEFETSYAPDRPEIVYCEQCYQQEVA
jgi:hypothetical protein